MQRPDAHVPDRILLLSLILAFLLLSILYSFVNPAFESPDEIGHFGFIQHLVTTRSLPTLRLGETGEAHQPPLYYMAAALATLPANFRDATGAFLPNPQFIWAGQGGSDLNIALHHTAETFPFHGQALALHLARLSSLLMALGTVLLTWILARTVFPDRPHLALLSAALVAFVPQFLFIGGSINNDNLATLLATAAFVQMARILQRPDRTRQWVLLGLLVALGVLAKLSGLAIGLLALILLIFCAMRLRSIRLLGTGLLALGLPTLVLAGWWFMRNEVLYGDPMAWGLYRQVFAANLRSAPLTLSDLQSFLSTQFRSFLAVFGWMNLSAPTWYYRAAGLVALAGLAGLALFLVKRQAARLSRFQRDALIGMVLAVAVQEIYIVGTLTQCNASCYQGRYLFPAIAPLMVLLAFGLLNLVPARTGAWLPAGLAVALAVGALYMPLRVIGPAYAGVAQPKWSLWLVPHRADATFGGQIRLRGYDAKVEPDGSAVKLTLYWQAVRQPDFNYSAFAHLLDDGGQVIAQQDHAPGEERDYGPPAWLPGDIVTDTHTMALPAGRATGGYRFRVGLYNWSTGEQLPASTTGQPAANFVLLDYPVR